MEWRSVRCLAAAAALLVLSSADHNDPNAVNSIYADIDLSAADLYDMFGFPSDDTTGGEKVVLALTFAPVPRTGTFDSDLLYRIRIDPDPRTTFVPKESTLDALLGYVDGLKDKFLNLEASEVRVTFDAEGKTARVNFMGFPGGSFVKEVPANEVVTIDAPDGAKIKAYLGGRDDAFFNDLPGFFRSINYAPQFYNVPHSMTDKRELPIPKTLLELEGNELFNFDPAKPRHGQGVKLDLPADLSWNGDKFLEDADGNFRFVYSGKDAQAGFNINAIILEIPLTFLTDDPENERIVNSWGESWILKATAKAGNMAALARVPERSRPWWPILLLGLGIVVLVIGFVGKKKNKLLIVLGIVIAVTGGTVRLIGSSLAEQTFTIDDELENYTLVDTDGQAFSDAALSERHDERQLGANNLSQARHFVKRFAHLGWGFSPSIRALGLKSSFDDDGIPVSVHKMPKLATTSFPRVKKALFQELNMPDNSWDKRGLGLKQKRAIEIFIPNLCAIDMDTTGTWPFGRRPEDQVATRFLSVFLDHTQTIGGKKCHVDTLGDQALWDSAPIVPKTPPNPLKNDKPFLKQFPYLAAPW